ncbi:MAG TPA: tyrosine-type recombinase/integrase [Glycomyces sp.]
MAEFRGEEEEQLHVALGAARGLQTAEVDDRVLRSVELAQEACDGALRRCVVTGHEHDLLARHPARVDHHCEEHRVQGLDDPDPVAKAGITGSWTPLELRHSFVSLMSDKGATLELVADLVGHASTTTTATVYRHQLRPVMTRGAELLDNAFDDGEIDEP